MSTKQSYSSLLNVDDSFMFSMIALEARIMGGEGERKSGGEALCDPLGMGSEWSRRLQ